MADSTGAVISGIASVPGNASLLGWAMSSLTLKGKPSDNAPVASVNSSALTSTSSNVNSVMDTPSVAPVHVSTSTEVAEHHAPASPTSTDGWGGHENGIHEELENDKDGWDDLEPLEELNSSPALTNIQAAQRRPMSQPVSQTKQASSLQPKSKAKLSKDEDHDLWGSISTPAPKTSKNLNMKSAVTDDDPWAAIAAPAPTTKAKPLSAGRGRGPRPALPKLSAQRINRTSSGM